METSTFNTREATRHSSLQFGHGYVAVETVSPLLDWIGVSKLQFGHGYVAVETPHAFRSTYRRCMLQFGHGYVAVETLPKFDVWNSQGAKLQFGHGYVAVETRTPTVPPRATDRFNSATAM